MTRALRDEVVAEAADFFRKQMEEAAARVATDGHAFAFGYAQSAATELLRVLDRVRCATKKKAA